MRAVSGRDVSLLGKALFSLSNALEGLTAELVYQYYSQKLDARR